MIKGNGMWVDGRGHKGAASKASKWSARLHWLPRLSAAIRTIVQTICRQLVEVDCHLCCTLHFELGQVRPQWMGRRQCWFCPGGDWNASGRYSIVRGAKLVTGLSPCLLVKAWIVLPGQNFYWGLLSALAAGRSMRKSWTEPAVEPSVAVRRTTARVLSISDHCINVPGSTIRWVWEVILGNGWGQIWGQGLAGSRITILTHPFTLLLRLKCKFLNGGKSCLIYYRTRVRSLVMLVSNWLTESLLFSGLDCCQWYQVHDDVATASESCEKLS